jgi:fatty-acyl-CoA synthase
MMARAQSLGQQAIWHPGFIAATDPDRPAVICGDIVLRYGALEKGSQAIAAMVHAHGLAVGDSIAMLIGNRPEFFTIAWSAQRSGLYYVPISPRLTATEIAYILGDCRPKALFVDPEYAHLAAQALAVLGHQGNDIACYDIAVPIDDYKEPPAVEGGDMLYTSGTTGKPKGVRRALSGDALGRDARRVERVKTLFGLGHDSVFLSTAPLYHAAPLRFTLNLLRTGGTVVCMPKFDAANALQLIAKHRITHSQWVPTMFSRLLALPEAERNAHDLSSHCVAIHAGAPCAPELKRQMIDWWGPILHEYYSGTESVGFTHVSATEWLERPGTVGRAYGCTTHILGDDGQVLPAGSIGAVYFESTAKLAYHNDPAKTRAAHDARGWATLGDIGYLDDDGFLFLTDRRAFTIISGGVNIYPSEIEAVLSRHPAVRDCAVFGVSDADMGESVFAVIELEEEASGDPALAQALAEYAAQSLARFKVPRQIAFGPVGRTETGKLQKAQLRETYISTAKIHAISNLTSSTMQNTTPATPGFIPVSPAQADHV